MIRVKIYGNFPRMYLALFISRAHKTTEFLLLGVFDHFRIMLNEGKIGFVEKTNWSSGIFGEESKVELNSININIENYFAT